MDTQRRVKCLILPVGATALIVPNIAAAEIVSLEEIAARADTADWFLGFGSWRGSELPLIAFDRLCGERQDVPPAEGRFVILFGLGGRDLPFYGMRIEALPRSETVDEENLQSADGGGQAGYFISRRVIADTRECAVPNLDAIEDAICAQTRVRA